MATDSGKVHESAEKKPQPIGGSRKGRPNKLTADVRAMIITALDKAGGVEYLQRQASESPAAFMSLVGKCLPKEIVGVDGKDLFPITAIHIHGVAAKAGE